MRLPLSSGDRLRLQADIQALATTSFEGFVYRNLDETWRSGGLSGGGARDKGARWNPKGISTIYLSDDQITPLFEIGAVVDGPHGLQSFPLGPRTILSIETRLQVVLDLRDRRTQKTIGLTRRELAEDWRGAASPIATQEVGLAVSDCNIEAILVPSVARHNAWNIVVFQDNLRPGSWLRTMHSTRQEDTIEG
jgi:RES domain-containing protein